VLCLSQLQDTGAGRPDFGLYTARQAQRGEPRAGQMPERGVVEVKSVDDDAWLTADSAQISKYWQRYRLVLVTNYRDFLLLGEDAAGRPAKLESFRLAPDARSFWDRAAHPQKAARELGRSFGEYLTRVLGHAATLTEPKDVAWFLASYARDALARVEGQPGLPALVQVRAALESALGITFEGEKGLHFFYSTLVQTLFYGLFSAWVLWARDPKHERFGWRLAAWYLRVPIIRSLFHQLADPTKLQPLGFVEVMNWAASALGRVDRSRFFAKFEEAEAVQYFYEPFLAAYDPELRKELGVWYTPREIVAYMVERVDRALRDELGIADGLADKGVQVLDPCCGTGAYLVEVLRRIDRTLDGRGLGALKGQKVKQAALERVHGFEIMPAPFVVAHLQLGLFLQGQQAPLADDGSERASVWLTNALTGWSDTSDTKARLPFPELEDERDHARHVKREETILVVLGNPPYNGYAGLAVEEERALVDAYRVTRRVRRPEGQGLNDLYVRFFRMAERRIVEMTGKGVVCFISNYSWLDGLSFTGMRERYLREFGVIRIDCLNGDKYKTGKVTPDGRPDPSIFSTDQNREGIQVGTAIALLVRWGDKVDPLVPSDDKADSLKVGFRNLWGTGKRQELEDTAEADPEALYQLLAPPLELGLPLVPATVTTGYFHWPSLPELFPVSFPGVKTSRDDFLVSIDKGPLIERLEKYFDPRVSHEEMRRIAPSVMTTTARFDAETVRDTLRKRGFLRDNVVRYAYRPFDIRWLYWEPETELLDRERSDYWPHVFEGNRFISAGQRNRKEVFYQPQPTARLADHHIVESNVGMFPLLLRPAEDLAGNAQSQPMRNITTEAQTYLTGCNMSADALMNHVVALSHARNYEHENRAALRQDWPHIALHRTREALATSDALGQSLAAFLDPETPVLGVTQGAPRPELRLVAVPTQTGGWHLETALTAGWGYLADGAVMPGEGKAVERQYRPKERAAMAEGAAALALTPEQAQGLLGDTTFDVWLNGAAHWANVPARVWRYKLGGYQVVKKWLSYREEKVLGRALRPDEVAYVGEMCRRIAAILLMGPELDANYAAVKADVWPWPKGR
jgi:hypothetical protein